MQRRREAAPSECIASTSAMCAATTERERPTSLNQTARTLFFPPFARDFFEQHQSSIRIACPPPPLECFSKAMASEQPRVLVPIQRVNVMRDDRNGGRLEFRPVDLAREREPRILPWFANTETAGVRRKNLRVGKLDVSEFHARASANGVTAIVWAARMPCAAAAV
jgi:hypothetical protein